MKALKLHQLNSASVSSQNEAHWLSEKNVLLSTLLGCRFSNKSFILAILFNLFVFASLLLSSDMNKEYGWAAFCGMAALHCAIYIVNEFKKGGK